MYECACKLSYSCTCESVCECEIRGSEVEPELERETGAQKGEDLCFDLIILRALETSRRDWVGSFILSNIAALLMRELM